jgi:hypothetical protein
MSRLGRAGQCSLIATRSDPRVEAGNRRRSSAIGGDDPRATSRVEVRRTSGGVVPWGTAIALVAGSCW